MRCGIAEYSRTLLDAMPRDGIAEPVVLADDRAAAEANVRVVWQLGNPCNADRLAAAIAQTDADVTVLQHQPGLLPWPILGELIGKLADAGRATVVTLHNTLPPDGDCRI